MLQLIIGHTKSAVAECNLKCYTIQAKNSGRLRYFVADFTIFLEVRSPPASWSGGALCIRRGLHQNAF